jgi:hypothetical protein
LQEFVAPPSLNANREAFFMKFLTVTAIAGAVTLGTSLSAVAKDTTKNIIGGQPISGQIESINGSKITVKTASGETQNYKISPTIISALKLEKGSNIVIDGSRLKSGTIKHLDPYTAEVRMDGSDEIKTYVLTREARRFLSTGDRVIIESGGTRIVRADRYVLSSSELRVESAMVASSAASSSSMASTKVEVQQESTATPPPAPVGGGTVEAAPPEPVVGLW